MSSTGTCTSRPLPGRHSTSCCCSTVSLPHPGQGVGRLLFINVSFPAHLNTLSPPPPPLSAASSPADSQLSSSPSSMRKTVSGESIQHSSFTSVAISVNLSPHMHIHTRTSTHAQGTSTPEHILVSTYAETTTSNDMPAGCHHLSHDYHM